MAVRRRWVAGGVAVAAAVGTMIGPGSVHAAGVQELITGLSSPKGVSVGPDGGVVVSQGAFGPPGPVMLYDRTAPARSRVVPITEPFALVDVAISPLDGTGWAIGSEDLVLYHQLADGTIVPVLDIPLYQSTDPDPVDKDVPPNPTESNPYGLTVMPNGDALVADAAGNDVIRVTPDGDATTVARLDIEVTSTSHIPSFPAPALPAEAVPTTVTIGPDGAIYVGELKGFPFTPGASKIWRVEADAEGAWCSVNAPSGGCSLYMGGLTAIQDIDFEERTGRLFVLELAAEGTLAFEAGFETGEFPPAVLLEVRNPAERGERVRELAAGQLSQPGGVAIGQQGQIFVTDGVFFGGRLVRVLG